MQQGLKNLQSAARAATRRERHENGMQGGGVHTDDSGIGLEDLEGEYEADARSDGSSGLRAYDMGSAGLVQDRGREQFPLMRLPTLDMGIGAIINPPGRV